MNNKKSKMNNQAQNPYIEDAQKKSPKISNCKHGHHCDKENHSSRSPH